MPVRANIIAMLEPSPPRPAIPTLAERTRSYTPGVSRGLDPREAVDSIEDAIGCDLGLFDGFWLGVPGEADMRVGPYTKKSLLDFSYYAKELSCRYGFADSDILEIARHLPDE